MAIHKTVILLPSMTRLIGWTVGASTRAGYAGSVQAMRVSEGILAPLSVTAFTKTIYWVFGSRDIIMWVVRVVLTIWKVSSEVFL